MSLTKFLNKSIEKTCQVKRICVLKPTESELQTIYLQSGVNAVGRDKVTGIRDVRCSKKQLTLDVDLEKCRIKLKTLGVNPCSLNGFMMVQGTETVAEHGDILEIVYGRHSYEIVFKPPPSLEKSVASITDPVDMNMCTSKSTWQVVSDGKLIIFTGNGVKSSKKIAGYDMDGTIITTQSGNVFPKNTDDWKLLHPEVCVKLKKLWDEDFKVCLFTNQGGLASGRVNLNDFKNKIQNIASKLKIPIQVFIAVGDGMYRKPATGMWNYLSKNENGGVKIDLDRSFYVGDAAGRDAEGKRKRDHSCCDRLFALNVGLKFLTPEEHFFNQKPLKWTMPEFNPTALPTNLAHIEPMDTKIPSNSCELIILVGLPGSGKSVFAKRTLEPLGYTILNADTLGSTAACATRCEKMMQAQNKCVIDNTNVDVESRMKFIAIAKKYGIPCRCFVMNVKFSQVQHNIAFRQLTDSKHSKINQMVMNTMKKKYTEPSFDEGFTEVAKVNLKYEFQSKDEEKLYKMYLVEK